MFETPPVLVQLRSNRDAPVTELRCGSASLAQLRSNRDAPSYRVAPRPSEELLASSPSLVLRAIQLPKLRYLVWTELGACPVQFG